MSFLNIKDKRKREATIQDFLATKERIKKRNLDERSDFNDHQQHLEQEYEPIVASNKEMAEKITDQLIPIKKDLDHLNSLIARPKLIAKRKDDFKVGGKRKAESSSDDEEADESLDVIKEEHTFGRNSTKFIKFYKDENIRKSKIDTTFGIRDEGGIWKIGNKRVTLTPDDDMVVGDETYKGTIGFWSLVVLKSPHSYTTDDLNRYKELLHETSAMHQEYDPLSHHPRANRYKKWKNILSPIWKEFQWKGVVEDPDTTIEEGEGIKMYLR